ncbi:putative NBD/HSP70 family sugar kinase [Nocardioides marinisabuli]|uniref:Putative NBD/HSP70 family sugar kinase n=1 Tax=Nocardioides marinisabuli TaxID=419476 RepID=A0A7Y9EYY0_9ACTN|nr:ROK family protein [Nocardioides marinisabuli]NYD56519.1 putative NBD/HSP70 family sugar kinase [Nocardioides marinisabuli]
MTERSPGSTAGDLLTLVRTGQAGTRADLVRLSGLSRGAVTARLGALLAAGLLVEGGERTSTGGRPAGALALDPDAAVVLAVAVGRSRSQVGVFDLAGREISSDTRDHEPGIAASELMPDVVARLGRLLEGTAPPVVGVGMSLPGSVDPARGTSVDAPVLKGWDGVDLASYVATLTDAPLHLDNDTAALTRSELFGRVPAAATMLVVKASTGLGMGLVADGRIVGERRGTTGELGHTRVDVAGDLLCRCGATGCLETVAGGWALVGKLQEAGIEARHVRDLVALALDGDPLARNLLREAGRQLGEVLTVAVNLLHPEAVVVGGDMGAAFDLYTAGVRESLYSRAHPGAVRDLRFLPAAHGEAAGLLGCAALAIDAALSPAAVDAHLRTRR